MSTHKHKVGKERPPIWAAAISGLPTFNMPSMCTSTHTLTHTQLHDTAKEKQLPPNRTFSIKETRIPLTFKKRKKGS